MLIKLLEQLRRKSNLDAPHKGTVVLVDTAEDDNLGRIKVTIPTIFDETDTDKLPWVYPVNNYGLGGKSVSSGFSVPEIGSVVLVVFPYGDVYYPAYVGYWQSKVTHQKVFQPDYPESYGHRDKNGTFLLINKQGTDGAAHAQSAAPASAVAGYYTYFQHGSGSRLQFRDTGDVCLHVERDFHLHVGRDVHKHVSRDEFVDIDRHEHGHTIGDVYKKMDATRHTHLIGNSFEKMDANKDEHLVGNLTEHIEGTKEQHIEGNIELDYDANIDIDISSTREVKIGVDDHLHVVGKAYFKSDSDMHFLSAGVGYIETTGGKLNMKASGNIDLDGTNVNLNGGSAGSATAPIDPTVEVVVTDATDATDSLNDPDIIELGATYKGA